MPFDRSLPKISIVLITVVLGLIIYRVSEVTFPAQSIAPAPVVQHVSPHAGSWRTWFHPDQSEVKSSKQDLKHEWNIFHHLGGNGPWIENTNEELASTLAAPEGCSVDQVHLVCFIPVYVFKLTNNVPALAPWGTISNAFGRRQYVIPSTKCV
jgi:acid phosphatase